MTNKNTEYSLEAEFDSFAEEYYKDHARNIEITGENPEFFSEYKIRDLRNQIDKIKAPANDIVDFGSGIGNSIPFFRKYFPESALNCVDVSGKSIEISKNRFPGNEKYAQISENRVPLADNSVDIVFSACVFHHIPHSEHVHWMAELRRITKPGGSLFIYEHNPYNPLTLRAVNTCPFDANAHLITAPLLRARASDAGWVDNATKYRMFFPSMLAKLRVLEKSITWLPLGAQYFLHARK